MSLYAAYAHPDVFGRIGAMSPSIWWKDRELLTYAAGQPQSWLDVALSGTQAPATLTSLLIEKSCC